MKIKIIVMVLFIICGISLSIFILDKTFLPLLVFNLYCNTSNDTILRGVHTHGKKEMNIYYKYLFNKNNKINSMLEQQFFDERQTNLIFGEVELKRGDVAWALYTDINFDDSFYDILLNEYTSLTGYYLFLATIRDPSMRSDILYIYKVFCNNR